MRILIVDDKAENLYMLESLLKGSGYEVVSSVNGAEALEELRSDGFGLIISDILMPVMDGYQFCREVMGDNALKEIPFIFYTATYTETKDEEFATKLGADKFIRKPIEPEELINIIQGVIKDAETGKKRVEKPVLEEKEVFKLYNERLVNKLEKKMLDLEMEVTERKRAEEAIKERMKELQALYGLSEITEREGITLDELFQETVKILPLSWQYPEITCARIIIGDSEFCSENFTDSDWKQTANIRIRGTVVGKVDVIYLEERPELDEGPFLKEERLLIDAFAERLGRITERKQAEEALRESEGKYRSLIENAPNIIMTLDCDGIILSINRTVPGLSPNDVIGKNHLDFIVPECRDRVVETIESVIKTGEAGSYQTKGVGPDEIESSYETFVGPLIQEGKIVGVILIINDITELKHLEDQFRQSQKMEGIGRLAGGVAHDFNNLLTVITGHAELAMTTLDTRDPLRDDLKEIQKAGERAAELTRQLLAFSRKQTLQPKVLSLNTIITNLDKMLQRVIGEDIDLKTISGKDLWNVEADPGQIEQIIINLAVNARDAMPEGGKLTIETQNIELDKEYARTHSDVTPGPHVVLAISDTGCGMTDEVKTQVFEPFFTTKGEGKGTGLGLSTVYGIVKQSGGNIWLYSELEEGTTFKVYLPMVADEAEEFVREVGAIELPRGSETVLVVEDEEGTRKLVCRILKQQGYHIIEAQNGGEALMICKELEKPVDLVLTDVIMPNMGGTVLVKNLHEILPDVKVLYMSGYTTDAVAHAGVLDSGTPYLQKPFRPIDLAWKVRRVLDE